MNTLIIAAANQPLEWPEASIVIAFLACFTFLFYCVFK